MEACEHRKDSASFVQKSDAFLDWFKTYHRTRISPKIQLVDLRSRGAGRGVVALQDIAEDEELFAIPRPLVLTPATSDIPKHILQQIGSENGWLPLIVTIIYEKLRGAVSQWHQYFQILPSNFDTLMFWSDNELAELQASAVISKIGKADTEKAWNDSIIPIMLQNPEIFPLSQTDEQEKREQFTRLAHIAGSLIMAYAFDIDKEEDNLVATSEGSNASSLVEDEEEILLKGMVPFADMLNADAERNNARLFQEDGYLVMKSIQYIVGGEEIFNDYGPLPRSDLLRMYGYITHNYCPYDVVELSYEIIVATAKSSIIHHDEAYWHNLEDNLDILDLREDGYTISRPTPDMKLEDGISGQLHTLLRYLCGESCKRRDWNDEDSIPKFPFTTQETQLLGTILRSRLAQYHTTAMHDQKILEQIKAGISSGPLSAHAHRFEMAVRVRKGEKEICEAVHEMCRRRIELTSSLEPVGAVKRNHHDESGGSRQARKLARKT